MFDVKINASSWANKTIAYELGYRLTLANQAGTRKL